MASLKRREGNTYSSACQDLLEQDPAPYCLLAIVRPVSRPSGPSSYSKRSAKNQSFKVSLPECGVAVRRYSRSRETSRYLRAPCVKLPENTATKPMTEYELLRIISFLEKIRAPYDEGIGLARPDAYWNILLCLMKATLKGEAITKSTLAQSANIPFPSAMRKISQLIEEGVILEVPKRQYGSSYVLKPSQCLRDDFSNYASKIKVLLAATFGLGVRSSTDPEEYYFGGSYMEGQVIPRLNLSRTGVRRKEVSAFCCMMIITSHPCHTCGQTFAAACPREATLSSFDYRRSAKKSLRIQPKRKVRTT